MLANLNELMPQGPMLLWPLGAGVLLGLIFFGGLWWTVQKIQTVQQPALWFVSGFVVRISTVLVGIYWVSADQWQRLLACVVGLLLARFAVLRFTAPDPQTRAQQAALLSPTVPAQVQGQTTVKESPHAS